MFTTFVTSRSAQRVTAFMVVLVIFACVGLIAFHTSDPVQANPTEEPEFAPVGEKPQLHRVIPPDNVTPPPAASTLARPAMSERVASVSPPKSLAIESSEPEPPIRIGGRVEPARPLLTIPPQYPKLAVRARVEGTVALVASVTEDGALDGIEVVSGHPLLIDAAVECVRQWKYMPAKLNGTVIRTPIEISVRFVLQRPSEVSQSPTVQ